MTDFGFYFRLGWEHIISIDALDHILFIAVLAIAYIWQDWRRVLILVTAFTIGHSITLALSVTDLVRIPTGWVEFLIPCTIVFTAATNFFLTKGRTRAWWSYLLALGFGLIHGLGFANTLRFILADDQSLGWSLLGFNVGLEAGQIIIVVLILTLSELFYRLLKFSRKWWVYIISAVVLVFAFKMALERFP